MPDDLPVAFLTDAQGFLALLALCATALVAVASWRMMSALLLAFFIIERQIGLDLGFAVFDYKVFPIDILCLAALSAAALRMWSASKLSSMQILWIVIVMVMLAAFVRGASDFGFKTAMSYYRLQFYGSAAMLYMMSFRWNAADLTRFVHLWIVAAAILAALVVAEWAVPGLLPHPSGWSAGWVSAFDRQRVLPAASALVIAEGGLIGLALWSRGDAPEGARVPAIVLLMVAAGLYHRTVWVCTLLSLVVLILFTRTAVTKILWPVMIGAVVVFVLWAFQVGIGIDSLTASVTEAVSEPFSDDSSAAWRVTGWRILLERAFSSGPLVMLFGAGFGAGYERMIGYSLVEYSPHNFFVELLLDTGLLGAGLWVLGFLEILLRLVRGVLPDAEEHRACLLALLATLLAFNIPYSHPPEQGLLLGVLATVAMSARRPDPLYDAPPSNSTRETAA